MKLPPAIIVHGMAMAQAGLRLADERGCRLTLLSAPGAGIYGGVGWWRALVSQARPGGFVYDILDCGDAPGRALEALRCGQTLLILNHCGAMWDDVAARAAACGATLLAEAPPALDMAEPGAMHRLPGWLAGQAAPSE